MQTDGNQHDRLDLSGAGQLSQQRLSACMATLHGEGWASGLDQRTTAMLKSLPAGTDPNLPREAELVTVRQLQQRVDALVGQTQAELTHSGLGPLALYLGEQLALQRAAAAFLAEYAAYLH